MAQDHFDGVYFDGGYFGGGHFGPGSDLVEYVTGQGRRDDVGIEAIADKLLSTGIFDAVVRGASPDDEDIDAGLAGVAWVKRTDWHETDLDTPYDPLRTVDFSIWIESRDEDSSARQKRAVQLEVAACNAINGQSIGGFSFPWETRIFRAKETKDKPPEYRVECYGRFVYRPAPGGYGSRDVSRS